MARPIKEGLDYFPLDVDVDQDDKVAIIEATHGLEGFGVVIKMLMKIYSDSYFYEWGEKERLLFSRRVNVDINRVNDIVDDCLKWGLFSKELYESHGILTSIGIQRRYLEACVRRKEVRMNKEYLLLDEKEVNTYKNIVIVDINSIDDDISTQSKVKESKGKNSKESGRKQVYDETSPYYQIASYFLERIRENNPDHKTPNLQTWSNDVRLMMKRDNRTEEQIKYLMKWVQEDDFECVNVLSPSKLRKRFDQLVMKVKQEKERTKIIPMKKASGIDWEAFNVD